MKQGDQIQDRYVLDESLGRGGMAEVWRATDRNLERPVAIKFLAPQLTADPEFLVRFFSEAQSVAGLSHPNVVSVLDFGEHDGAPYLVMEFVPRGALTQLTGDPVQPERAAEIVRDAALGAGAAHVAGIVHRDIKPGNILLCDDGRAVIADFGIALTAFAEKLTATGQVIGSPHYIAPEQAAGKGTQPPSDVYALGVVLYELLTGHPPFDADNATAIAIAHVDRQPEPPSQAVPDLDPGLEAVVLRALAKDPGDRYRDGNELARALEDAVPSLGSIASGVATAGAATAAVAGAATFADTAEREVIAEEVAPPRGSRAAAVAAVVVVLLALGAGAWALMRDEGREPRSVASAAEADVERKKPRPKQSESYSTENDYVVSNTTPTPTASPTEDDDRERDTADDDRRNEPVYRSGGGDDVPEEQPTEEPSPSESPTPEEEPSSEPTPEPSEVDEEAPE